MSQNAYEPPRHPSSTSEDRAVHGIPAVGSGVLTLLGGLIIGMGVIAGDGRRFFLLHGVHVLASGGVGAVVALTSGQGRYEKPVRLTSMILNALVIVQTTVLILNGTVRGPLIVALSMLLVLPALLNVSLALKRHRSMREPRDAAGEGHDVLS